MKRFKRRWPRVKLRLRDALYPRALHMLRSGEFDFILGPLPALGVGHDLQHQVLFHSQEVIAARRAHPLGKATRLAELVDAHWIVTGPTNGPGDPSHLRLEARGLPPPQIEMECESFSTLLGIMPTFDVIGIMPSSFLERHGRRTGLIALPIKESLPVTTIYAVTHASDPLTLPAQDLFDAFLQEARDFTH